MLVHIAISGQSLVSGAMQIMSSMPSPKGLKPNLSAKKAKEKRKVKGKGKGKNYYNTKEFKIASKRVYKNWPYNWTPKFRRGLLHTNTVFPRIVSAETILFWKLDCDHYSREETILLFYFLYVFALE